VAYLSGFKIPMSHLFWIETLQYYGDYSNAPSRYPKLFEYCRMTADLNPHFLKPYELGASVLAFQVNRPQEAIELLRRGIETNPSSVRLKLLLASIGYLNADQYGSILPLMEGILRSGDAPPMMVNILANTYQKAGRWDDAIRVWRWILNHSNRNEDRDGAARALEKLYQARRSAEIQTGGVKP
jgi:tetratricopeptide (TPR) repeat protein